MVQNGLVCHGLALVFLEAQVVFANLSNSLLERSPFKGVMRYLCICGTHALLNPHYSSHSHLEENRRKNRVLQSDTSDELTGKRCHPQRCFASACAKEILFEFPRANGNHILIHRLCIRAPVRGLQVVANEQI